MLLAVVFLAGAPLGAHDPGLSSSTLWLHEDRLQATLAFAPADMEALLPMDLDRDGQLSKAEFEETRAVLERFVREGVQVSLNGESVAANELTVEHTADQRGPNFEIRLRFPGRADISHVSVRNALLPELPLGHRHYVMLFDDGANLVAEALLDRSNTTFEASLDRREHAGSSRSFGDFFVLGVEHILTGYDHLLFLLGLLVVGAGFTSAAKIITSFTAAHSITLALATFGVVQLAPAIVEPLIAVSIAYVGVENIVRRNLERRWILTFVFGLIHGLGFASVLRELGVGAEAATALQPLVAFNLGVEAGQISIAAVAVPILLALTHCPRFHYYLRPAASLLVAALGTWWLMERMAWS
jgi:hydrogenase/urease accessory protein HupE